MAKTNCTINGSSYYRVFLELGKDSNGKRKTKPFYGKNKKEAEMKKQAYINKLNSGLVVDHKLSFSETMRVWLFEVVKVGQIKLSSFTRYEGIYSNYFKNSPFACISIDKITPLMIQRYYNELYEQGKSSNVINNANKLLKQFMNYCVDCGYILKNPCDGKKVIIPRDTKKINTKKEVEIFTPEEMRLILNNNEQSKIRIISLISYATGMRKGEILALKEENIDYDNEEIHITNSLVTTYEFDKYGNKSKKTYIDTTKTYSSMRDIPLPKSVLPLIDLAINIKREDIKKASNSYNKSNSNYIFLTENGQFIDAGNIDKSWIYFLKRCKVKHKKFHALRHTYATLQFENDIPLLTISKLLGHATIDITANTYTHVVKKLKSKSVDTLSLL